MLHQQIRIRDELARRHADHAEEPAEGPAHSDDAQVPQNFMDLHFGGFGEAAGAAGADGTAVIVVLSKFAMTI